MKLSAREDIDAPAEKVFLAVTDFENFERLLLRRGADVERLIDKTPAAVGMKWAITGSFRGKRRRAEVEIAELNSPRSMVCDSKVGGVDGTVEVELTELSPRKTRLIVKLDLKPTTLSARLLVQSLKFAKASLKKRFQRRLSDFAGTIS